MSRGMATNQNLQDGTVQYELTVTGSNWTTTRAVGVLYSVNIDGGGTGWRLRFNIVGTVSSPVNAIELSISGITFKNVVAFYQPLAGWQFDGDVYTAYSYTEPNTDNVWIVLETGSTGSTLGVSGDAELESEPSL